jgi:hypothetical protein
MRKTLAPLSARLAAGPNGRSSYGTSPHSGHLSGVPRMSYPQLPQSPAFRLRAARRRRHPPTHTAAGGAANTATTNHIGTNT